MSRELALAAIPWLVTAPLVGAGASFVARRRNAARAATVPIVLVALATLPLLWLVWHEGRVSVAIGGWSPPLGIALVADGVSATLVATTTLVCAAISIYAASHLPAHRHAGRNATWMFWPLWLCLWAGINGAFLSGDLFNLYVTIEVIGLSAVALVALSGGEALMAAARYIVVTLVGSLFYLLGVALVYADYGLVDMATLGRIVQDQPATQAALVFITLGLALKTAIVPLHFWLVPAHGGALGPISAVLSGLVVKVTFYVLLRLWVTVFPDVVDISASEVLGVVGALAIVWGSAQAIVQSQLKRLVAYSTVAQLGYLLLAFPLAMHRPTGAAAWPGVVLFVVAHACAKAAMFLVAGSYKHAIGDDELGCLRGVASTMPATTLALGLAGMALIGLPPSGTFAAKWLLLDAAVEGGRWVYVVVIVGGSLLAAAYVFKVLAIALREPADAARARDVPMTMRLSALVLALVAASLGLLPGPPLELIGRGAAFAATMEAR